MIPSIGAADIPYAGEISSCDVGPGDAFTVLCGCLEMLGYEIDSFGITFVGNIDPDTFDYSMGMHDYSSKYSVVGQPTLEESAAAAANVHPA